MLYYIFHYLAKLNVPGARLFEYISFRAALATIISLMVAIWGGKHIIKLLKRKQINENIRDLSLQGQIQKNGTPTMGGIIIILAILIPVLLTAKLENIYIIIMLVTTVWLGMVGFADDYIKTFKHNKKGLPGRMKIYGQVTLGLFIGVTFFLNDDIQIIEKPTPQNGTAITQTIAPRNLPSTIDKPLKTTIPFVKNNQFNYEWLVKFMPGDTAKWAWIIFFIVTIIIITAVSNGANLTDGLDGLAAGSSAIIGGTLAVFAYLSGNIIFANYLNIMYIPHIGELVIFTSAFMGATIGFLWYNSYPAQIFMGDTGSLTIGGIIAVLAIIVRKELLIPILAGIFLIENLSVIIQVTWFKITKKITGTGKRVFLMSPIHHHYQKKGIKENKIVVRFWIVGILLAIFTIITLKIR